MSRARHIAYGFEAGVVDGHNVVAWSAHKTAAAARAAAARYSRRCQASGPQTGGAGTWSGFWRAAGGAWQEWCAQ